MKNIILITLLSLSSPFWRGAYAQYNLVVNPSFEDTVSCPNSYYQVTRAVGWNIPLFFSTADYLNSCNTIGNVDIPKNFFGYELAHTGNAYAGVITYAVFQNGQILNYREYIQGTLTDSLTAGVNYFVRWYVSAGDSCNYVCNNIGIYFSQNEIHDTCPTMCNLQYLPQIENPSTNNLNSRNGWTEISGFYTAIGGEKYIIIGNFRDTTNTIATYTGWSSIPDSIFPNREYSYYYVDDILITPHDSLTSIKESEYPVSLTITPNPFYGLIYIESKNYLIEDVSLIDVFGRSVFRKNNIKKRKEEINVLEIPKGLYFLNIKTNKTIINHKVIKN